MINENYRKKKREYCKPNISSEKWFATNALACGKNPSDPPVGSWHYGSAYDTFTGHFGPMFGGEESNTGSAGIGMGPGGTSASYMWDLNCYNWVAYTS